MAWYDNVAKRNHEWLKENSKGYTFRLYATNERDRHLMEVMDTIDNKAEFFREAIEEYERRHDLG